jgi:DNA (cytosine-5)-methyltransferase 1
LIAGTRQNALRAVDSFAGAGGLSVGLRQAGFQILVAADYDPDGCATYRLNFPEATVVEGDLTARDCHEAVIAAAGT